MNITYDKTTKTVNISFVLPDEPGISKSSGKANNCGGTGGFVIVSGATVQGKLVKVSVNAIC